MPPVSSQRAEPQAHAASRIHRPRLGFLGLGWIGLQRMQSLVEQDIAEVAVVADADDRATSTALQIAPSAERANDLAALLEADLDGVVIATPSAMHSEQARAALRRGLAVFCQKPLARTASETAEIVDEARRSDHLLGVDLSYRAIRGVESMQTLVREGALGQVFAIDLTFHNAYGPDKEWFRDLRRSGGGCVIDLGIHLIDFAHWILDEHAISDVHSSLWHNGEQILGEPQVVEDCAFASWRYPGGATARLACSWNISAGQDAVIEAVFYGARGSVALRNVNGSFYDFVVERREGTQRALVAAPPDAWGGRALARWTKRLALGDAFDPEALHLVDVARLIDRIYRR